jgi:hypothetical protein
LSPGSTASYCSRFQFHSPTGALVNGVGADDSLSRQRPHLL